jgi:molybdate transport system substrate-binding protein
MLVILSCEGANRKSNEPLLIAAASNVQFVLEELVADFQDVSKINCETVISSSGKLTSQIISGATFDILVSADQYYPQYLNDEGLTDGEAVQYARGKLVFWSKTHALSADDFDLSNPKFKKIAIANPRLAPYGKAAISAIENMGLSDLVTERLVYGENISQVNQFINVGAADIGLTSQSIVYATDDTRAQFWLPVPDSLYSPILQDFVILKKGRSSSKAKNLFGNYMVSPRAQIILEKYGYEIP